MRINRLLILAFLAALLAGCTQTYVTPMAVAQPRRADFSDDQSAIPPQKSFFLPGDWQYNNWVMKKGTKITFYADGFGEFEGTVYSQMSSSPDELHFQAIQYGKDGNRLFTFPASDVGHPIHIRHSFNDYPQTVRFAYNKKYFDSIHDCKFHARMRLKAENFEGTTPSSRRTHSIGHTTFDMPINNN
ncbi:MAG: hypothetical protein AAGJ79_02850 [Verrucomicrobiota bacterium]